MPSNAAKQLGLPEHTKVLDVGSPFDYRKNALLYVAKHLPDPRTTGNDDAILAEIVELVTIAGGRTLVLCTSRRMLEASAAALRDHVDTVIYAQDDLPKPALIEAYTNDETSSLVATMGFWQGVDVPGSSLSMVIIDKLPFPRPDDPLLSARRDQVGPAAFSAIDLPRAATLLAQGTGRLIRTATDRGVIAVLDARLAKAGYRNAILNALPPMKRSISKDEVRSFLSDSASD